MSLQCCDKFTTHLNQRTINPNTENIKPWLIDIGVKAFGFIHQPCTDRSAQWEIALVYLEKAAHFILRCPFKSYKV
jgi:hypothetical protein